MQCELIPTHDQTDRSLAEQGVENIQEVWGTFGKRYELLRTFCGGLPTVLSGTPTVESEFSTMRREETSEKSNISKLTIAGAMHSKQWNELRSSKKNNHVESFS